MDTNDSTPSSPQQGPDPSTHPPFVAASGTGTPVVGVGASAGGLTAIRDFLAPFPADAPIALVVVIHLKPDRESQYAEVLQSATDLTVREVSDTAEIQAGCVYVIPPGHQIDLSDGILRTTPFSERADGRYTINHFFKSLAEVDVAAGVVVMSGGGTDGARGVSAIRARGGFVLVQDPNEAEHDSMPRAAIATGDVDEVGPAKELGPALMAMIESSQETPVQKDLGTNDEQDIVPILDTVHSAVGHDFSGYKPSTVLRRIHRRMQVTHSASLSDYLDELQSEEEEAQALFRELLVGVTRFFRDAESFDALEQDVIPNLFEGKTKGDMIRVWVVGCSTGEEVYSLAMLLREYAEERPRTPSIQIFASDLNQAALQAARRGFYSTSIEQDISADRLQRFFEQREHGYTVTRELRDDVIFSQHNVLRDPPFSQIDLVSCRNVLIFLQRAAQQKVLQTLHYALKPGGYLFLGSSESPGQQRWFRPFNADHHIYQAQEQIQSLPQIPLEAHGYPFPDLEDDVGMGHAPETLRTASSSTPSEHAATTHLRLLERTAPPSILVDADRNVIHLSESAGRYLQPRGGTPSQYIADLAHPDLRDELSEALNRLFVSGTPTAMRHVPVQFGDATRDVYLSVQRGSDGDSNVDNAYGLILFIEGEVAPSPLLPGSGTSETVSGEAAESSATITKLRNRLSDVQRRLRESRERFKQSRERMQAQNEELRSMNEEYKSATEELETSKEELQSVNEELETVNNQLEQKLDEVSRAHSDLRNLIDATDIATVFLDDSLQIKRFTPSMNAFFHIRDADLGRPITELAHDLDYDSLRSDAQRVLDDLSPIAREIQDENGNWYLVRVRPYRTVDNVIDGVVLTFIDITEQKHTEERLQEQKGFAESIINTIREGLVVLNTDLRITSANAWFYNMLDRTIPQAEGKSFFDLCDGYWDLPDLRDALHGLLEDDESFEGLEVTHTFDETQRTLLFNARRLEQSQKILLAMEDITQRKVAMEEVQELNEKLKARVRRTRKLASDLSIAEHRERERVSHILHDDLQQLLYAIEGKMQLILNEMDDPEDSGIGAQLEELQTWTKNAVQTTRQLTVDLSPPILREENLADAIEWLKSQMKELHDFEVIIEAEDTEPLGDDIRLLLFQIVRELLFNAHKHAGVDVAVVRLESPRHDARDDAPDAASDAPIAIHVIDQGKGFDPDEMETSANGGFGLSRAQERLDLLGGHLSIESAPGRGTQATIYAPPLRDDDAPSDR